MHTSSMQEMTTFVASLPKRPLKIADIGAKDEGGTYKPLFSCPGWDYKGMDLSAGTNVDVVLPGMYLWPNVPSNSFDVIISGQTVEHVERPWLWIKEIARIVRPKGLVCIIGPYQWQHHRYPVDCWRVFPDGMHILIQEGGLTALNVYMNTTADTVGIATKGEKSDLI